MKPAPFEYHAPETLPEALELMAQLGADASPLAGGQSLTPLMNLRLARPAHVVDLNRIESLDSLIVENGTLRVGPLVRHSTMEHSQTVRETLPLAGAVAPYVGHPAIRHRGTVVGSIAHADPAAEWPCLALALNGLVTLANTTGTRQVPAESFFQTMLTTVREPDELVTEVSFSTAFETWGFYEFARRHGDFAVIAVAVTAHLEEGVVAEARVSMAGARDRPIRALEAENALVGEALDEAAASRAADVAKETIEPLGDIHGSTDYRRELISVAVERALNDATNRS